MPLRVKYDWNSHMSMIYNSLMSCASGLISIFGTGTNDENSTKRRRFLRGQKNALSEAAKFKPATQNFWFHCASLGEYAIARPLLEDLRRRKPDAGIVLTFFSPTGMEAMARRPDKSADLICYLPLDSAANARRFIDLIRPSAAMFMVSEYWPNYLEELRRRSIPTFLVSNLFSRKAPHFRRISGGVFRQSLKAYTHVFCLNKQSMDNLASLGFTATSIEGDPLVDNALKVSETSWRFAPLEDFCTRSRTLIAGSISDDNDIQLLAGEINCHPDRRYLLVPHEVDEAHISELEAAITVPVRRLSRYVPEMTENVMIVDNIGMLAYLYRLGTMAYIGGGFTRELHSVLEATVYGLPIAFGPRIERKVTPQQLIDLGMATMVNTPEEFSAWADSYFSADPTRLHRLRAIGRKFCHDQAGATSRILTKIMSHVAAAD